jgi:hypothetical protein
MFGPCTPLASLSERVVFGVGVGVGDGDAAVEAGEGGSEVGGVGESGGTSIGMRRSGLRRVVERAGQV